MQDRCTECGDALNGSACGNAECDDFGFVDDATARREADKLAQRVVAGELSFEDAVRGLLLS